MPFTYWQEVFLTVFTQSTVQSPWAAWIPTIEKGFKLYQLVQIFPVWLQCGFIFGFLNLLLVLYDVHIARAAIRGDNGLNPQNIVPVRLLLQRGIIFSATLFLISLNGPLALLTALYFYLLLTCRYFLSGGLVIFLLVLYTLLYKANFFEE